MAGCVMQAHKLTLLFLNYGRWLTRTSCSTPWRPMEETFEPRDRKRPLKAYAPTERQAIERQAPVHRRWQPVDALATLKSKCPCGPRFASLSGVVRVRLPVIRFACAWGLVLSLSATAPPAV